MVRLLGITIGESNDLPREITKTNPTSESIGENGWLIRFFDSAFFCEWIAVSYLYKHGHSGVRDYLCNRMYTLPLSGIESYLFQICYMMVHIPSPSLDKFVIDICSKSLKIALRVHWFLMAEIEDADDNEGISRIQEKCQIAATLMGEWPPLIRPQYEPSSLGGKNQVLNKLLSSKQRLLSLASSPSTQKSFSFSPTPLSSLVDEGGKVTPEENKILKKFIPSPKVRDALMFRKSADKDVDDQEKDGFFRRLLNKDDDEELTASSEGFFKRLFRDSKNDPTERSILRSVDENLKEGFLKKIFKEKSEDKKGGTEKNEESDRDLLSRRSSEGEGKEGFFKKFFKERFDDKKDGNDKNDEEGSVSRSVDEDLKEGFLKKIFKEMSEDKKDGIDKNEESDRDVLSRRSSEDEGKEGFIKKLFKEKFDDKKDGNDKNDEEKSGSRSFRDEDKDGFFRKLFKEKFEDRKDGSEKHDDEDDDKEGLFRKFFKDIFEDKKDSNIAGDEDKILVNSEEEESSDLPLLRRLLCVHPEEAKPAASGGNMFEGSPGTENFFRKLFRDRDRSVEDSELYGLKKQEMYHGSTKEQNEKASSKPPLPNSAAAQFRKGAYHKSLDFVRILCDTSYGLVDVFPIEDRKSALNESLAEINAHLTEAQNSGGVCFPMGKGVYRVLHIPENEAVLLNSREKAPYLICVEVLRCETPSMAKDLSNNQKISRGGIPLANGDALFPKPPPWAYPLWTAEGGSNDDRMSQSASQAIDKAMDHLWDAKVKFVNVNLSVNKLCYNCSHCIESNTSKSEHRSDPEWVRVVLTANPGLSLDDIEDLAPPRRKEHRRVPSTIAMEEVKAAAAKGEAPPGLPLKGAGQEPADAQPKVGGTSKPSDALCGELWEAKKQRIRNASVYGNILDWDMCSMIVKSGDDCRQEHLAVQLISHFYDIFQEAGLPLWLRPYEVLVTSSYTALIETIPDTASIHSIKSRYSTISSLREFFNAKYEENSPGFKLAQRNFVESMAGYSLVCYLLQVKDRHNGNLLLDEEGHIIHIDFGFMLSNSPGGVNFESAPFKLTRELLEVMDSDAEGVPSEFFDYFKVLCIQGFLTCRKHAERIILLVEMLQDSGFPCFKGGPRAIQNLRKRFHLSLTEEQCVSLVLSLISSSLDAWRTRQYDYYQRVLNGIL